MSEVLVYNKEPNSSFKVLEVKISTERTGFAQPLALQAAESS